MDINEKNNFHGRSPKEMRNSHSLGRSMQLSCRHACWEKYLQYLLTHSTLIVVRFAISITDRITLPGTAEFSVFHSFPKLSTLVLKRERRADLWITWSVVLLLNGLNHLRKKSSLLPPLIRNITARIAIYRGTGRG